MKKLLFLMKEQALKYKHGIPLILYGIIYLVWFSWLETNVTKNFHIIHIAVDDYIPFCEVFIVPYLMWFAYVAIVVAFFFFTSREDYYKTCMFLFTGMTIFLIISTLWPNGHHLRPIVLPRENIFTQLLSILWKTDTPTNLWPSIHVYNSLGAHFAVINSKAFKNRFGFKCASFIMAASIIASTVLIKQHSMFDVITAFIMAAVMYTLVYRYDIILTARMYYRRKKETSQIA